MLRRFFFVNFVLIFSLFSTFLALNSFSLLHILRHVVLRYMRMKHVVVISGRFYCAMRRACFLKARRLSTSSDRFLGVGGILLVSRGTLTASSSNHYTAPLTSRQLVTATFCSEKASNLLLNLAVFIFRHPLSLHHALVSGPPAQPTSKHVRVHLHTFSPPSRAPLQRHINVGLPAMKSSSCFLSTDALWQGFFLSLTHTVFSHDLASVHTLWHPLSYLDLPCVMLSISDYFTDAPPSMLILRRFFLLLRLCLTSSYRDVTACGQLQMFPACQELSSDLCSSGPPRLLDICNGHGIHRSRCESCKSKGSAIRFVRLQGVPVPD